jgi:two-component system, OmpR family, sensor histidine kinase CiaH
VTGSQGSPASRVTRDGGDAETRRGDVFSRASTRLFLLFAAIVIVLLVVSGITTYAVFSSALHDVTRTGLSNPEEERLVTRTDARLRWQILAIDGVIVVAIGGLGFWYARRTLRPIRENFAAQKRFIADASHELRTPLAIMKTEFEVALRREPPASDAARTLESGLEEVDRMSDIVQDLLTLSRIDARQEELSFAPVDLAALAQRCAEKLRPLAERRGVGLTVSAAEPLTVDGDAAHLERALLNVVRNAIEHSRAGGEIVLAALSADGQAVIEVRDEGEGIAPADLPHIFDRFYRGDEARSRRSGGSGLGLAITRWIVEHHRGAVTASSALGEGTTIRLSFPPAPVGRAATT